MIGMKNFQIFLKDGRIRNIKADRVEITKTQVMLYVEDRIVETYERSAVIMMDESTAEQSGSPVSRPPEYA